MKLLQQVKEIMSDILDIDESEINEDSYLFRDLDVESIDLIEIAVAINGKFSIEVQDDEIFLKKLRFFLNEADENKFDRKEFLIEKYPFLREERITDILQNINYGPVLKIMDLTDYIAWQMK